MPPKASHKKVYIIIGVVALLLVLGIAYKVMKVHENLAMTATTTNSAPVKVSSVPQPSTTAAGLPNKTDTSNQQLDQDEQNIQSSMDQLQQDQNTTTQDTVNQAQDVPQQ